MIRDRNIRSAVAEPLVPMPTGTGRRVRDWSARSRGSLSDALRYTRFVGVMKRALPIAAGALVAAVLVYTFLPRQSDRVTVSYAQLGRIDNDLAMIKPRLSGSDAQGNPFVVTADVAIQDRNDTHRARLRKIEADMTLDRKERWVNAMANKGLFDMDQGTLALSDGLSAYSDSGYELHSQRGNVNLKTGVMEGPVEVTGQGPMGNFRADRYRLDRKTHEILLFGNVHMTMYPENSKGTK
jgi:lipopolysaccharide export system protein LptC